MKVGRNLECSSIVAEHFLPSSSRESLPTTNPADETVVGSLVCASLEDIHDALETAENVRQSWRQCPAAERGAILTRAGGLMRGRIKANTEIPDSRANKTLGEPASEWVRAVETLEWHGEESERFNAITLLQTSRGNRYVAPEPVGVIAAFTPWNYPALIIARKLSAALVSAKDGSPK